MSFEINGSRLRQARQYRKLTVSALGEMADISKQMVSRYERGSANPSLEVFRKLVASLKFPMNFFTEYERVNFKDNGTFFRSRLTATQVEKSPSELNKKAAAVVRDYFGKFIEFPELFDGEVHSTAPVEAAVELRKLWELGDVPIDNMVHLLESHGIVISILDSDSSKVDAHSGFFEINQNEYYLVQMDTQKHSFFREQFTLAHELGHFILHADVIDPAELEANEYREMEKEADDFASEFLMPKTAFITSLRDNMSKMDWYIRLKSYWNVTIAAMIYRARNLNVINGDQYLKLQKSISYRGWRKGGEPLDDDTGSSHPELLHQSLDLLEDNDILKASMLSARIGKEYGVTFPNEVLAGIIGVPLSRFNGGVFDGFDQLRIKRDLLK